MNAMAKLERAHKLIMQAAAGPSLALVKGKGKRSELAESVTKLREAADILEGMVNG